MPSSQLPETPLGELPKLIQAWEDARVATTDHNAAIQEYRQAVALAIRNRNPPPFPVEVDAAREREAAEKAHFHRLRAEVLDERAADRAVALQREVSRATKGIMWATVVLCFAAVLQVIVLLLQDCG